MQRKQAAYQKHRAKLAKRRGYLIPEPVVDAAPKLRRTERTLRANLRYGRDLEHRAVEAFTDGEMPWWFIQLRPASYAEDQAGIDLWVDTDRGSVPVQVKASALRAALFRDSHPGMEVAVVVLHLDMEDQRIRDRVLSAVERIWRCRQEAA